MWPDVLLIEIRLMADHNKCLLCKLHKNNPQSSTNGCKHEYDTAPVEKQKQAVKEVWLPYCPFCGKKTERPQGLSIDGELVGNMMVNSCQLIAANDVCVFCRCCRLHFHIDARPPKETR